MHFFYWNCIVKRLDLTRKTENEREIRRTHTPEEKYNQYYCKLNIFLKFNLLRTEMSLFNMF